MALGRTTKISLLLSIDLVFFFIELIVGYAVGSLALVADSFHMLNDVMSLVVALYAIRLTSNNVASSEFSYGWHRAEILAALINGVFLLALCFSIFLEAIERFFSVPEVGAPKLVVIVGSLGLLSNIVGLFLFHEHGHSHDNHATPPPGTKAIPDANATPTDLSPLLPAGTIAPPPHGLTTSSGHKPASRRSESISRTPYNRRRSGSGTSISFHPAQVRASLVQVAEELRAEEDALSPESRAAVSPTKKSPLRESTVVSGMEGVLAKAGIQEDAIEDDEETLHRSEEGRAHVHQHYDGPRNDEAVDEDDPNAPINSKIHSGHSHGQEGTSDGHGHSHQGSMNMRAVLLHVIGDALGNVGVIATGLVIWLTDWEYRFYCDPVISLVITIIIFSSALPLVRSTSYILLQGVPTSVSLDDVRSAILAVPGVISVHELHIWQLSESKIVASVHVLVTKSLKTKDGDTPKSGESAYMCVAAEIRRTLHDFGIHSSTIQPEYAMDGINEETASVSSGCLIPCAIDADCDPENACCPPALYVARSSDSPA